MSKVFLEWSCKQKFFHIADAGSLCEKNLESVMRGGFQPDYRPIGIFDSDKDAGEMADKLREKFPEIFSQEDL